MSAQFISLEEAAKKLGVNTDELVEMRSRGDIFGYRDGASWKFKPEEIERVAAEMMGSAMDEDPAGSSILVSEQDLGPTGSKHGSTIGSDINIAGDSADPDSDVALIPDPGSGSDVRLVAGKNAAKDDSGLAISDDDDDELSLASDDDDDLLAGGSGAAQGSDIKFGSSAESAIKLGSGTGTGSGSDVPVSGSDALDLDLGLEGSDILSGSGKGSGVGKGSDVSLDLDDNDDLVLSGGSDLALGNDSGINLMSPADSGISLEDEPLDLAASGISGLDLASEGGSDAASGVGSGLGSAVNFQQDEEFQLSASGGLEADEDSGSQVIELEDSSEFGDAAVALPAADGFDAFGAADDGGLDMGGALGAAPVGAAVAMGAPEIPYSLFQVLSLLGILLLMCMSGILVTDVVRNMWAWGEGSSALTSGFTEALLSSFGAKK